MCSWVPLRRTVRTRTTQRPLNYCGDYREYLGEMTRCPASCLFGRRPIARRLWRQPFHCRQVNNGRARAAAWLERKAQADGGFKAQALAVAWARHDPAAALAWAHARGIPVATPIN